jgi:DNA-binding HxlR family transcriptional regulator
VPKPSQYQEKVRQGNRMFVLSLLKDEPMRFSELQDLSGMSPRGLAKVLANLGDGKLISREMKGRWPAYIITKKGRDTLLETMTLGIISDEIVKANGQYFHDYSKIYSSIEKSGPWGIKDDIIINKELEKEIPEFLYKIIKDMHVNIYKKFQDIMDTDVDPMKVINQRIVVGFVIDTTGLLQSIKEDSIEILEQLDKSTKVKPKKVNLRVKKK